MISNTGFEWKYCEGRNQKILPQLSISKDGKIIKKIPGLLSQYWYYQKDVGVVHAWIHANLLANNKVKFDVLLCGNIHPGILGSSSTLEGAKNIFNKFCLENPDVFDKNENT